MHCSTPPGLLVLGEDSGYTLLRPLRGLLEYPTSISFAPSELWRLKLTIFEIRSEYLLCKSHIGLSTVARRRRMFLVLRSRFVTINLFNSASWRIAKFVVFLFPGFHPGLLGVQPFDKLRVEMWEAACPRDSIPGY